MAEDVVKSVGRVFDVLELFQTARQPMSATQVERSLNYPQSSTLSLLKSMVKLGYLSFDRIERSYFPTMRVAYLGQWIDGDAWGEGRLAALVEEVSDRTGETVALSCQNDLQMQFQHIRPGNRPLMVNIQDGSYAPLFQSIIGLTALSVQDNADIARLVQRTRRKNKAGDTPIDIDDIMTRIDDIRQRGHGVSFETYVHGVGVLAWALPGGRSSRPTIISVAGPSDAIQQEAEDIAAEVRIALHTFNPGL